MKLRGQLRMRGVDRSEVEAVFVVGHSIFSRRKPAQLNRPTPFGGTGRREERVIHLADFLDGVSFGNIVAIYIKVPEIAARQFSLVINRDPFLPLGFFFGVE